MIIRQLCLRHGRKALAKPPGLAWRRTLASGLEQRAAQLDSANSAHELTTGLSEAPEPTLQSGNSKSASAEHEAFAAKYWESQALKKRSRQYGATSVTPYEPHLLVNHPPNPQDITLELLMASQAHMGHAAGLWHPGNARYIYGIREGIHIISLDATASHLRRACKIVEATALEGGLILFVGTRSGQERSVVKAAELAGGCHVFDRWIPGSITNRVQILAKCLTKVVDQHDSDVSGFESELGQQCPLKPDLVVCLNPLENHVLLRECNQHQIPTIGVVDTDCNPALVTYPIPANDDSRRCTNVIAGVLGRAAEAGRKMRLQVAAETGLPTYELRESLGQEAADDEDGDGAEMGVEEQELEDEEQLAAADGQEPADVSDNYAAVGRLEKLHAALEMYNLSDQQENPEELLEAALDDNADSMKTTFDADPVLERLVAVKRRALGEELSSRDKELLKDMESEEAKARALAEKSRQEVLDEVGKAQKSLKAELAEEATAEGARIVKEMDAKRAADRKTKREERGAFERTRRGRA